MEYLVIFFLTLIHFIFCNIDRILDENWKFESGRKASNKQKLFCMVSGFTIYYSMACGVFYLVMKVFS